MTKWGLKFYIKHHFDILTKSGEALIFKLSHTLWGFTVDNLFQYKNDIFNFHFHKCLLCYFCTGLSKLFFDGKRLNDIDFRLKNFQIFLANVLNISLLICLFGPRFSKKNSVYHISIATILVYNIEAYFNFLRGCFLWMRLLERERQLL